MGATGMVAVESATKAEKDAGSPPPLSPAVTAPVRAFSEAFEAVAAQVRPAVVSVYSEKTIKMDTQEWNPFGGDLFRHFFGRDGQMPQEPSHPQRHEYKIPQRAWAPG